MFRVKGIGEEYSDLLEAAGVDTVPELAQRRADNLTQKMAEVNEQKQLVRRLPTEDAGGRLGRSGQGSAEGGHVLSNAFGDRRSHAGRSRAAHSARTPSSSDSPQSPPERPESFDKSLGELLKQLLHDVKHLIDQEIALVKAEMNEKIMLLATVAGLFAGAAILGLFAFGVLTAAIVLVVDLWLPAWLAALIVTGAYLAIAGVLVLIARSRLEKAGGPVPEQTVESLKEEVAWVKEQGKASKPSN